MNCDLTLTVREGEEGGKKKKGVNEGQKEEMRDGSKRGKERGKKGKKKEQEILQPHYQRFYYTSVI